MNFHICKEKTVIQTYLGRIHRKHFFIVDSVRAGKETKAQGFVAFVGL